MIGRRDIGLVTSKDFASAIYPSIQNYMRTKGLRVQSFHTVEEFYQEVKTNVTSDYCFGFEISDVLPGV